MKYLMVFLATYGSVGYGRDWVLAVLGDSVSAGTHAETWSDSPEYSWATGDEISSIKVKMQDAGAHVYGINVAQSGGVMADLDGQISDLVGTGEEVNQVMILMGHNDVCHWDEVTPSSISNLAGSFRSSLQTLSQSFPQAKVYMLEFLDIAKVREIASDRLFCQWKWDLANFCPQFMSSDSTPAERGDFLKWWDLAQQSLKDVVAEFPKVTWVDGLSREDMSWEDISSIDCVHPSVTGQELLANQVWGRLAELP